MNINSNARARLLKHLIPADADAFISESDGDVRTVKRALTPGDLADHVAGRRRIGAIPFVDNEHVAFSVIDLDYYPDKSGKVIRLAARKQVKRLAVALRKQGLRPFVERSKSKGYHIWTFFDHPVKGADVRAGLSHLLREVGIEQKSDTIVPRQDTRSGPGNGVYLPLAGGSQRPYTRFVDPKTLQPFGNQLVVLRDAIARPTAGAKIRRLERKARRMNASNASKPAKVGQADLDIPEATVTSTSWILDELRAKGVDLDAALQTGGKIRFRCPLHLAESSRTKGGSAVFFQGGNGQCSSSRCGATWSSVAEFLLLLKRDAAPALQLLTDDEFENDEQPRAIVDGFVYRGGVHLITGPAKAGKSILGAQLLMAVTAGQPFLGMRAWRSRTLLVSLEMAAAPARQRMETIAEDVGIPRPRVGKLFKIAAPTAGRPISLNLRLPTGIETLRRLMRESKASLVLLDTLGRFLPDVDPNAHKDIAPVFDELDRLAIETDAAIVILDHTRKGMREGSVSQSAIGTQAKGATARVIAALHQLERGKCWSLDVESHFGSWDAPIFYTRPTREDGSLGMGCVLADAASTFTLGLDDVEQLFREYGELNGSGQRVIATKTKLQDAFRTRGMGSGNKTLGMLADSLLRAYASTDLADRKPIFETRGPRKARVLTWIGNSTSPDLVASDEDDL